MVMGVITCIGMLETILKLLDRTHQRAQDLGNFLKNHALLSFGSIYRLFKALDRII